MTDTDFAQQRHRYSTHGVFYSLTKKIMFIRINLKKLFYKQTKRLYIKHKETSSDNNSE